MIEYFSHNDLSFESKDDFWHHIKTLKSSCLHDLDAEVSPSLYQDAVVRSLSLYALIKRLHSDLDHKDKDQVLVELNNVCCQHWHQALPVLQDVMSYEWENSRDQLTENYTHIKYIFNKKQDIDELESQYDLSYLCDHLFTSASFHMHTVLQTLFALDATATFCAESSSEEAEKVLEQYDLTPISYKAWTKEASHFLVDVALGHPDFADPFLCMEDTLDLFTSILQNPIFETNLYVNHYWSFCDHLSEDAAQILSYKKSFEYYLLAKYSDIDLDTLTVAETIFDTPNTIINLQYYPYEVYALAASSSKSEKVPPVYEEDYTIQLEDGSESEITLKIFETKKGLQIKLYLDQEFPHEKIELVISRGEDQNEILRESDAELRGQIKSITFGETSKLNNISLKYLDKVYDKITLNYK